MKHMISRCFIATAFAVLVASSATAGEADFQSLSFTPWTKYCLKEICFVVSEGHSQPDCEVVVSADVIERLGDPKKSLHVSLPPQVRLESGVRIIVDQGEPIKRPYVGCSAIRCTAEYEGGEEFFDQIKHGHTLALEAVDKADAPIRLIVPLVGYADAYDGAPQEPQVPKVFELTTKEMQAKLNDRKSRCGTER
jgi:invasion protein IalB